jgi:hypothetical protein
MLLKVCADKNGDILTISEFCSFFLPKLSCQPHQKLITEKLSVNIQKVMTMLHVIENALEKFKKASQEHAIVVGDGKI